MPDVRKPAEREHDTETPPTEGTPLPLLRRLTREEARAEQRLYWMRLSPAERLAAAAELKQRMYLMRGIDLDELKADWTVRRVPRSRR